MRLRYLAASVAAAGALGGFAGAPPAAADCNYSGGTTLCASGDVRGSSNSAPPSSAAPYSPYPCYDYGDPLCLAYDNYDPGIIFNPPNIIIGGGRPGIGGGGRPGGGIGRN